ncbi:MAG: S24 family peptidase, partial [Nitrospinota bacterium]|nr:S24 family peptidase [Nitrospinota bacterium]
SLGARAANYYFLVSDFMKTMRKKSSYLADYIKDDIDKKYRTRSEAAEDLGIDESVLSRICSGKRPGVSESIVEGICDSLGLDKSEGVLRLFLTKHSKIRQFFSAPKKPITFKIIHPDLDDKTINYEKMSKSLVAVPLVSNEALDGFISLKHRAVEHLLVPKTLLKKDHNVQCSRVKGGSMDPTLPNGSIVAIDFDDRTLEDGNIFLLKWKRKVLIRRIVFQDSYLLLCPDNMDREKYSIEICSMKKAKSAKDNPILGKVIWAMSN